MSEINNEINNPVNESVNNIAGDAVNNVSTTNLENNNVNNNQKKGKKIVLPIKIIIIGAILGILVAGIGGIKQLNAKKVNEERANEALETSQKAVDEANARLKEIETEYENLQSEYTEKTAECDQISSTMGTDPDWYTKSSQCMKEESALKTEMNELELEDNLIKNKDYTVYYTKVDPMSYQIFYIIGASIAGVALLGAFIIYLVKGKKSY